MNCGVFTKLYYELTLPSVVVVTLDDNSTINTDVTWQQGPYNGNVAGVYIITGILALSDDVTNTADIKASIGVTVEQAVVQPPSDNHSGGGGGTVQSETKITTATGENGIKTVSFKPSAKISGDKVVAVVEKEQVDEVLEALGQVSGRMVAVLDINTPKNAQQVTLSVPKTLLKGVVQSNSEGMRLLSGIGNITFDQTAVKALDAAAGGDLEISVAVVDKAGLAEDVREAVGDRPILNLSIKDGNHNISKFNGGTVQVEIPYTLKSGEDANAIVVYFIDDNGELHVVKASGYDAERKAVIFTVKHFSKYAIGYQPESFSDTNMWAKDSIAYLAARGILSGVGDGRFEPDRRVTRAEFIKLLIGSVDDIELDKVNVSNFSDVGASQWYAPYIVWGLENNIVNGYGDGRFGPADTITREQMAVMLDKFIKVINVELPQEQPGKDFKDAEQISLWAKDAVQRMQKASVINGKVGNIYDAKGSATRAEAAKVIQCILKLYK